MIIYSDPADDGSMHGPTYPDVSAKHYFIFVIAPVQGTVAPSDCRAAPTSAISLHILWYSLASLHFW